MSSTYHSCVVAVSRPGLSLVADLSLLQVEGPSMLPTMATTGEAILVLKWINVNRLRRGDLITFTSPLDPGRPVCKRITGLPGDIVCVDPTGTYAPSTEHVVVPKNHLWVTGDNLAWSRDSRVYGPIPMGLVNGRMYARVRVAYGALSSNDSALNTSFICRSCLSKKCLCSPIHSSTYRIIQDSCVTNISSVLVRNCRSPR